MRCATVGSGTRNARAISAVLRPPQQPQGERHPRLGRQDRMAGNEHQPQQVVADVIVEGRVEIRHGHLRDLQLVAELFLFAFETLPAPQEIDRAALPCGHDTGARIIRDARLRPLLERGEQRILCEILGLSDVAYESGQARDEPGRLDPPDRLDGAIRVGSRHGTD
jgi:hypothetical protein